jgi:hypothetical protein
MENSPYQPLMTTRHRRKSKPFSTQAAELSFAVPQVVTHRLMRMALAGPVPNSRDSREFRRMGNEKTAAFFESWNAMFNHLLRAQFEFASSMIQSFWFPWMSMGISNPFSRSHMAKSVNDMLGKGLAPVHRRAVANAKRLGNTRLH